MKFSGCIVSMHTAIHLQQCGILQSILGISGPRILMAALSARDDHLSQYLLEQNAGHSERIYQLAGFKVGEGHH